MKVELDTKDRVVEVFLERAKKPPLECPECGEACSGYDSLPRRWRHLDTCQYHTILVAEVPRCDCPKHGVKQIKVPWGEPGSRFTALFEGLVIDWLLESNISAVSRLLELSWDEVDTIMKRAVKRGLARKELNIPTKIGVDETSFQKRHQYVTVVSDLVEGTVEYVADDHSQTSLDGYYEQFKPEELEQLEAVAMDMWSAYINSTEEHVPDAEKKIAFDKFHVSKHLNDGVDKVRRQEHKELHKEGDDRLVGTKYLWLKNPEQMTFESWLSFVHLRDSALKTAEAWAIKELAMSLWGYVRRGWAEKAWKRWMSWASQFHLEPMTRVARMVGRHLDGILNAVVKKVTNAGAEGLNSKIQLIKKNARGFRNRERFKNAIYFYCGGLALYPDTLYMAADG